ncbi:DUF202 domain-containing protein [Candidatus Pacearchaeota archaeon]|nr:DUF202 domain-containing protein [Candidatus Pacearchaeota archaeon]
MKKSVDRLSLERTELARERTMLAYFRTAFTIFVFGFVIMKLFLSDIGYYTGLGSIIIGVIFFLMGLRYIPHHRK